MLLTMRKNKKLELWIESGELLGFDKFSVKSRVWDGWLESMMHFTVYDRISDVYESVDDLK